VLSIFGASDPHSFNTPSVAVLHYGRPDQTFLRIILSGLGGEHLQAFSRLIVHRAPRAWYYLADRMGKRKNPYAIELGRRGGIKGGAKGGKAIAAKRTPEERSEAARKAVTARWAKWRESLSEGQR
jgi:hypothetical protein